MGAGSASGEAAGLADGRGSVEKAIQGSLSLADPRCRTLVSRDGALHDSLSRQPGTSLSVGGLQASSAFRHSAYRGRDRKAAHGNSGGARQGAGKIVGQSVQSLYRNGSLMSFARRSARASAQGDPMVAFLEARSLLPLAS